MAIRIVRLGADRLPDEGIRIGTARRPPRGVHKADYATKNYYDVWLPMLAPSAGSVKLALASQTERDWLRFVKKYRQEMSASGASALISTLAALSHPANFSVGCYCADEARCHRSLLRELLLTHGAHIA
jgi:uncharacterized protein YeaO (DUF488 family)